MRKPVVVGMLVAGALLFAAPGQAAVPLYDCTLHAYLPNANNGPGPQAHGRIDGCSQNESLQLEVCLRVKTASGGYATKNETCRITPRQSAVGWDDYSYFATDAVHGHVYQSWVWGYASGVTNTYQSSDWTY